MKHFPNDPVESGTLPPRDYWYGIAVDQQTFILRQTKIMAITAGIVGQLVDAITSLIAADAGDKTALAAAQSTLTQLQSQDAALADPALQAKVDAALAAASAATAAPPAEVAAFDPAHTYVAGDKATFGGFVWTAVSPVLGESPSDPNWTQGAAA